MNANTTDTVCALFTEGNIVCMGAHIESILRLINLSRPCCKVRDYSAKLSVYIGYIHSSSWNPWTLYLTPAPILNDRYSVYTAGGTPWKGNIIRVCPAGKTPFSRLSGSLSDPQLHYAPGLIKKTLVFLIFNQQFSFLSNCATSKAHFSPEFQLFSSKFI